MIDAPGIDVWAKLGDVQRAIAPSGAVIPIVRSDRAETAFIPEKSMAFLNC